jgi:hypothetical protein
VADLLADLIAAVRQPSPDDPSRQMWARADADPLADLVTAIAAVRRIADAATVRYRRDSLAPPGRILVVDPPLVTRRVLIIPTGPAGDRAVTLLEAAGLTLEPTDGTENHVPADWPIFTAPAHPAPTRRIYLHGV